MTFAAPHDPVLHSVATPIAESEFGSEGLHSLVGELLAAFMPYHSNKTGVGLAAPQIGIGRRIAVLGDFGVQPTSPLWYREVIRRPFDVFVMCNPEITERAAEEFIAWETCLSDTKAVGLVARPSWITVTYRTVEGAPVVRRFENWAARIASHEIDHLFGRMCVSHFISGSRLEMTEYVSSWKHRSLADALSHFLSRRDHA